ncbi:MCP four helix bundle domain-containing protein, partial [Azospirillum picis]
MASLMNASVRLKVIAAFAILLICTVLLGAFSISRLSSMNEETMELRNNRLPSVVAVSDLFTAFSSYRNIEGALIAVQDDARIRKEEESLDTTIADLDKRRAAYERLLDTGWEADTYRKFRETFDRYMVISREKLRPLARRNETVALSDLFVGESRSEFQAAKALLEELVRYNRDEGVKAADRGGEIYAASWNWIAAAILVATAIGSAAALLILRAVVRPVHTLTGIMGRLAARELSVAVEGAERKDELGAMARAVQVFKDGLIEADRLAMAEAAEQQAKQRRT